MGAMLGFSPTVYVQYGPTTSPPPAAPETIEATSDIETVMGLAPAANIAVYETANANGVDLDPWTAAIIGGISGIPLPSGHLVVVGSLRIRSNKPDRREWAVRVGDPLFSPRP